MSLSCCLVSLCLASGAFAVAEVSQAVVTFHPIAQCPGSADDRAQLHRVAGVHDRRSCYVECSTDSACARVHHRPSESACYLATPQLAVERCASSVSPDSDKCESHEKATLPSKLIVFFDFRKGLDNLASPGRFTASLVGSVTRSETGAHFTKVAGSYINVDTEDGALVSSHLSHAHNFSFFARVERRTYYDAWVHAFHDCVSEVTGGFGDRSGKIWVRHMFPMLTTYDDRQEEAELQAAVVALNDIPQHASYGAAFTGSQLSHFYFNRTLITGFTRTGTSVKTNMNCLRLGFGGNQFNGRIICYAIAKGALTLQEMQQLDDACN